MDTRHNDPLSGTHGLRTLLSAGRSGSSWTWRDREHEAGWMNGIEAWVFAMRGEFRPALRLRPTDLDEYDLVFLNLDYHLLKRFRDLLVKAKSRRAVVIGIVEGGIVRVEQWAKDWGRVADQCDLITAINRFTVERLSELTSTPVAYIGIPYPVDGIRALATPIEERMREIFLCGSVLRFSNNYLAAKDLGVPMYSFEHALPRRLREIVRHRTINRMHHLDRARAEYPDPNLTIGLIRHLPDFLHRAGRSLLWMNLDSRYTWGRYVLDAAALGVLIVATRNTGHAPILFPDLVVDDPNDTATARRHAERVIEDGEFRSRVIAHAGEGIASYDYAHTIERLDKAFADYGIPLSLRPRSARDV